MTININLMVTIFVKRKIKRHGSRISPHQEIQVVIKTLLLSTEVGSSRKKNSSTLMSTFILENIVNY